MKEPLYSMYPTAETYQLGALRHSPVTAPGLGNIYEPTILFGVEIQGVAVQKLMDEVASLKERIVGLEQTLKALQEDLESRPATYNVQLLDVGYPAYQLRNPLLVTVEVYASEVVAKLPQFDLYASAEVESLALAKLKAELVSTFERLEELGLDQLGPLPRQWLLTLQAIVERVND